MTGPTQVLEERLAVFRYGIVTLYDRPFQVVPLTEVF